MHRENNHVTDFKSKPENTIDTLLTIRRETNEPTFLRKTIYVAAAIVVVLFAVLIWGTICL